MIIDCRSGEFARHPIRARVFVDSKEVHQVFYVDTEAGFVKSYDVLEGKGAIAGCSLTQEQRQRGKRESWDMPIDGAVSKIIRGEIDLRPFESESECLK